MPLHLSIYEYRYAPAQTLAEKLAQQALAVLDNEEQQRYARFKAPRAAAQFLLGRLILKNALASTLALAPAQIEFARSNNGKPFLKHHPHLHFSLTHCEGCVMAAVADANVGIDVESQVRFDREQVPSRFFSEAIAQNIQALTAATQPSATQPSSGQPSSGISAPLLSALYWTSIEALVKLQDSSVFSMRKQFSALLDKELTFAPAHASSFVSWQVDVQHLASIAVENPGCQPLHIRCIDAAATVEQPEKKAFHVLAKTAALELIFP